MQRNLNKKDSVIGMLWNHSHFHGQFFLICISRKKFQRQRFKEHKCNISSSMQLCKLFDNVIQHVNCDVTLKIGEARKCSSSLITSLLQYSRLITQAWSFQWSIMALIHIQRTIVHLVELDMKVVFPTLSNS